jgi:curved DNA-binding protein CbpA
LTKGGGDTVGELRTELTRLQLLDPFQVLAIAPDSGWEQVRAAYLAATKRYHPNRFARDAPELRDLATELFLVVRRAYAQLGDESRRQTWRARVTAPAAPPHRAARPMARASTPPATAPAPRRSTLAPTGGPPGRSASDARAFLDAAQTRGARYQQAGALLAEGKPGEARALLQKLALEDPQDRKIRRRLLHASGLEHLAAARLDEAVRDLERALLLGDEDETIARALVDARDRRQAGRGGIFSKLLGR